VNHFSVASGVWLRRWSWLYLRIVSEKSVEVSYIYRVGDRSCARGPHLLLVIGLWSLPFNGGGWGVWVFLVVGGGCSTFNACAGLPKGECYFASSLLV
jgi:hypothetical protein